MPTVEFDLVDLHELLGRDIPLNRLTYALPLIKCEVKSVEGGKVTLEVNADRPDMFSVEGIARALKGFLGLEKGYPSYRWRKGRVVVKVDRSVDGIRPYIACAVIRNLKLTDSSLKDILLLQEKLHETICRKRRKGSIGIYDLDKVTPPMNYGALPPCKIRFTPLEETRSMTAQEILRETQKGVEYGILLERLPRYPLLRDAEGTVLSMPPIINSEDTKLTTQSRNLFVDVTGLSDEIVNDVVNIVATSLGERGAVIESVKVEYPEHMVYTASLKPRKMELKLDYVERVSGLTLNIKTLEAIANKMRYGVGVKSRESLQLIIPPYRCDIIHPVDLVEDIIIGYGYDRVKPEMPATLTFGRTLKESKLTRSVRDVMVGYGFQEITSYVLTSRESQVAMMGLDCAELVAVANPTTREHSVMRRWLLPCLLEFLSCNTHVDYPQKVFECGNVVIRDPTEETRARNDLRLAGIVCDYKVSYEMIQSTVYGVLRYLNVEGWSIDGKDHKSFIKGRTAAITVGGEEVAILGEVHPKVLTNFKIPNPVAAFEINLSFLLQKKHGYH
ncbi:MAG: phenylalanine--tRNA ligase subunit beta [Candidatus Bathyarchaeia archaeon]